MGCSVKGCLLIQCLRSSLVEVRKLIDIGGRGDEENQYKGPWFFSPSFCPRVCLSFSLPDIYFPREATLKPRNKPWDTGGIALPDEQVPRVPLWSSDVHFKRPPQCTLLAWAMQPRLLPGPHFCL